MTNQLKLLAVHLVGKDSMFSRQRMLEFRDKLVKKSGKLLAETPGQNRMTTMKKPESMLTYQLEEKLETKEVF